MNAIVTRTPHPANTSSRRFLNSLVQEFKTNLLMNVRQPAFLIPTLLFPALFYAIFGLMLNQRGGQGAPAHYLFATYCAFGVMGPALFGFGAGLAIERQLGWLRLKRTTPMSMLSMLAAKSCVSVVFGLVVVLIISALALSSGRFVISPERWLLLWLAMGLGSLPFCALGLFISSVTNAKSAIAVVNIVYLPMSIFSGLWMPLSMLPASLAPLSKSLPAYYLGELALHIAGVKTGRPLLCIAALAAFTAGFLILAVLFERRNAR